MHKKCEQRFAAPTYIYTSSHYQIRSNQAKSGGDGGNTDDEYCIVDTQPQGQDNDLDEPVVQWLGQGPVYMFDNHFTVPPARTDVLKAPKSFPPPLYR